MRTCSPPVLVHIPVVVSSELLNCTLRVCWTGAAHGDALATRRFTVLMSVILARWCGLFLGRGAFSPINNEWYLNCGASPSALLPASIIHTQIRPFSPRWIVLVSKFQTYHVAHTKFWNTILYFPVANHSHLLCVLPYTPFKRVGFSSAGLSVRMCSGASSCQRARVDAWMRKISSGVGSDSKGVFTHEKVGNTPVRARSSVRGLGKALRTRNLEPV